MLSEAGGDILEDEELINTLSARYTDAILQHQKLALHNNLLL